MRRPDVKLYSLMLCNSLQQFSASTVCIEHQEGLLAVNRLNVMLEALLSDLTRSKRTM